MRFIIKKYNNQGTKIDEQIYLDILEAFSAMSKENHSTQVKNAKMINQDGRVFSRYYEFE